MVALAPEQESNKCSPSEDLLELLHSMHGGIALLVF
uniref:Uncharacterized protein n=1 Tax=Arundo donax TaxID=35708 RepID=A0A0A9G0Y6_ARUDO